MGKSMWRKHRSVFQDHVKYIHNDIVKHFRVWSLHYAESVCVMHDIDKYQPTPSAKGDGYDQADWTVREK